MTPLYNTIPKNTFCCLNKSVNTGAYGTLKVGTLLLCQASKTDYKFKKPSDTNTNTYFIFDVDVERSNIRARLSYKNETLDPLEVLND